MKKEENCDIIYLIETYPLKGGEILSKEVILKIKEAEEKADSIRSSASLQAKNKIKNAEAEGKRLCEAAEASAIAENEKKLQLIREKANNMIESSRDSAKQEAKADTDAANIHMREAVRYIIGGITEKCQ